MSYMSNGSIETSFQLQQQQSRGNMNMNMNQSQLGNNNSKPPGSPQHRTLSGVTLLISNLPPHADVTTLHELVSPYGRILSAQVEISESGTSARMTLCSGRGFVQMANISQAQYAIQALHGTIMFEGGSPLQV
jgi:RNA recognition motif-containing protein